MLHVFRAWERERGRRDFLKEPEGVIHTGMQGMIQQIVWMNKVQILNIPHKKIDARLN